MAKSSVGAMGLAQWGQLIVLSILWGGSFFFSKVALDELRPFTVVFMRVALAAVVLWGVIGVAKPKVSHSWSLWGSFFAMGMLNNLIPFSLIFWGQTQITSGLASILNATTPLWGIVLAHFLTADEKMNGNRLGGVLLGIVGVSIMLGADVLGGLSLNLLAQLAVIGGALSYAFAGIFGKRFAGIPPLMTATGQVTTTAIMMIPIVLWVDTPWQYAMPQLSTWGAVGGLAVLSTALAYILYFHLLATAGATNLLLVTLLIPASALLLGITFLGETLATQEVVGMGFIGLGLVVLDGRLIGRLIT